MLGRNRIRKRVTVEKGGDVDTLDKVFRKDLSQDMLCESRGKAFSQKQRDHISRPGTQQSGPGGAAVWW